MRIADAFLRLAPFTSLSFWLRSDSATAILLKTHLILRVLLSFSIDENGQVIVYCHLPVKSLKAKFPDQAIQPVSYSTLPDDRPADGVPHLQAGPYFMFAFFD